MTNKQLDKGIKFMNDLDRNWRAGAVVHRGTLIKLLEAMKDKKPILSPDDRGEDIRAVYEKWKDFEATPNMAPSEWCKTLDGFGEMWEAIREYCESK